MIDLEGRVEELEDEAERLVELLETAPALWALFPTVPGHLQRARRVEGDANVAVACLDLDQKTLEQFKGDVEAIVLNMGYAQGEIGGKNAEMRKQAEQSALVESDVCQSMARRVRDLSYRTIHAESLARRARDARRLVEDVSDAAYRLLRLEELGVKRERH